MSTHRLSKSGAAKIDRSTAEMTVDDENQRTTGLLDQVRAAFIEMHGVQPRDSRRGARAVIAAMTQDPPPRRLALGNSGNDAVIDALEQTLVDIRANETLSRSADFPAKSATGARHTRPRSAEHLQEEM